MPAPAVEALLQRGVVIPAPDQIFVDAEVDPARIATGVTLFPGTRLHGKRTYLGARASIGAEGPAVVDGCVFGADTAIASGYAKGAVLLAGAKLGANAHVREGTLLEEEASTAHAVGLKQTILLSFVTLGSLINFCDILMAGGTSRSDHSEVGSGFIHFNFTPWGKSGDKATASLIGNVVDGVLLDQARIFLGGSGGLVGPRRVGFGSITAAGQVTRRDVAAGQLVSSPTPKLERSLSATGGGKDRVAAVLAPQAEFIGQLVALRQWYEAVRIPRAHDDTTRTCASEAIAVIDSALKERLKRLAAVVEEQGQAWQKPDVAVTAPCPVALGSEPVEHVAWVRARSPEERTQLREWLGAIAMVVAARVQAAVVAPS